MLRFQSQVVDFGQKIYLTVENFATVQFVLNSDENLKKFSAKDDVFLVKGGLFAHCSKAAHSLIPKVNLIQLTE